MEIDHVMSTLTVLPENLIIEAEGPVHPWILASKLVIHQNCTTGMEAFAAGKNVINYVPDLLRKNGVVAFVPDRLSHSASSPVELVKAVQNIINYDFRQKEIYGNEVNLLPNMKIKSAISMLDGIEHLSHEISQGKSNLFAVMMLMRFKLAAFRFKKIAGVGLTKNREYRGGVIRECDILRYIAFFEEIYSGQGDCRLGKMVRLDDELFYMVPEMINMHR